jgi:hypothetical protein
LAKQKWFVLTIIDGRSRIQTCDDLMPHDKLILAIVWLGDGGLAESDTDEPRGFAACWDMSGGRDDGRRGDRA